MQRFKKRIRLLVDELNGTIAYGHDDSIEVRFEYGAAKFSPASIETMECRVDLGDGQQTFSIEKHYCFDVTDRLATSHLAGTLRDYPRREILQMDDYINEEREPRTCGHYKRKSLTIQLLFGKNSAETESLQNTTAVC